MGALLVGAFFYMTEIHEINPGLKISNAMAADNADNANNLEAQSDKGNMIDPDEFESAALEAAVPLLMFQFGRRSKKWNIFQNFTDKNDNDLRLDKFEAHFGAFHEVLVLSTILFQKVSQRVDYFLIARDLKSLRFGVLKGLSRKPLSEFKNCSSRGSVDPHLAGIEETLYKLSTDGGSYQLSNS